MTFIVYFQDFSFLKNKIREIEEIDNTINSFRGKKKKGELASFNKPQADFVQFENREGISCNKPQHYLEKVQYDVS